ncbi:hypothetical protein V1512DRAFT_254514 [Lipomyces arxii]|uniref:uncharacterized protein n=1 Tax=Lipomyces arxii TaxID=56418 RepID=UPI0034CE7D12
MGALILPEDTTGRKAPLLDGFQFDSRFEVSIATSQCAKLCWESLKNIGFDKILFGSTQKLKPENGTAKSVLADGEAVAVKTEVAVVDGLRSGAMLSKTEAFVNLIVLSKLLYLIVGVLDLLPIELYR